MNKYHYFIYWGMTLYCLISTQVNAQFTEVSKEAGISHLTVDPNNLSGGAAFFDFQNDGFEDIYLIGGDRPDKLYKNNGNGTFKDVTKEMGIDVIDQVFTMGVTSGDIDNDGFADLLVTTINKERFYLFWNNQGLSFTEGALEAGISENFYGSSAAMGDVDLDGNLDLYICNYNSGNPGDFLLKNNGDRTFSNVSELLGDSNGGTALAVAFSDVDMDHDVDILVGNDFGFLYQPNRFFSNNFPELSFDEISQTASWDIEINSMGIAVGDYDEDGDLDYYVSDIGDNFLFDNQGDNTFIERAHEKGIDNSDGTSWGNAFFDYNNDTYLDLLVANGVFEIGSVEQEHRLFKGNGSTFDEVSKLQGVASAFKGRGVAISDYNNDGQLDILVGVVSNSPTPKFHTLLYQNPGNAQNWVKVKLNGTSSNRDGYGSLVRVVFQSRSLIRELSGGTSYLSHTSNTLHFGLGTTPEIDSLIVTWPNGEDQVFKNLEVNHTYLISENEEIFKTTSVYKTIDFGEKIFLQGQFRMEEGVYVDTLMANNGLRQIVKTKLSIVDNVSPITGDSNDGRGQSKLKVWPNPFKGNISLSLNGVGGEARINVFDAVGHVVFDGNWNLKKINVIELGQLNLYNGLYLLQVNEGGKLYSQKIIKE
ncbi:FG-GAP-like repeat-containing protein [Reichenbachiella sp. MALMAid0571]|uniref:CRTAC1 family protein n=1 Tax=Reichenbachiella sp. MALMAid0571 TaxID=3143939 RepID=UPI0032DE75F9